jgi:anti-sigma regulatory factor (Ser/Thr protein kinase)
VNAGNHEPIAARPSADSLADSVRTTALPAEPASASAARRFVGAALDQIGLTDLCDDAMLCTAELATNAILHSRDRFTVAVRRTSAGVRIDVIDSRPDRLPLVVPDSLDPMDTGTTGRGLLMIAALADRWGYFTTGVGKTVWVELSGSGPEEGSTDPVVELADQSEGAMGTEVTLLDIPVRIAIASGVQVDELVRVVQFHQHQLSDQDRAIFLEQLERSARPRLIGRHEAFQAAAERRSSYRLHLAATDAELAAVGELSETLHRLAVTVLDAFTAVSDDVRSMRAWITAEIVAQRSGAAPTPYPGT